MAAETEVKIITVDAVKNIQDLRKVISEAKDALSGMTLGSEEYQKQLKALIEAQNLMRGAMNGTTANMDDLKKAADGTSVTYNGLVNSMANMKRELRNLDLSTAAGRDRFKELSKEIKNTNDSLKSLDEQQGSYVRNVGNYTSGLKNLGEILKDSMPALGGVAKGVGNVDKAVGLLGKQPLFGIIGLLAPLLAKIATSLKEDEGATMALKKAMDAIKPVTDFFAAILDKIVGTIGDLIGRLGEFLGSSGIFQKIVQGVVGVGNAILQFVIAPFKGIVAAIKVLQDEGVKGLGNAAKAFGAEMKSGVAFKSNFQAGEAIAGAMIAGAKKKEPEVEKAAKETGTKAAKEVKDAFAQELDRSEGLIQKAFDKIDKEFQKGKEKMVGDMETFGEQMQAEFDKETEAYIAELKDQEEAARIVQETEVRLAQEATEKKLALMSAYASGTSSLMGSIADLLEAQGSQDEKSVKAAKNLRIAAATIDMISGAVTAFSTAQQLGPIAGPIVGAINAAAVVAAGLANIAKIKSTNVSKDSAPTASAPETPDAVQTAPALETAIPQTTVVNGAKTETALNRASQPQKVYVLQSDIEAAGDANQVQVAESSF